MFDGVLAHIRKVEEDDTLSSQDIEVREVSSVGQVNQDLHTLPYETTITFEFRRREISTKLPTKRKDRAIAELPLGWLSLKTDRECCHLELFNRSEPLDLDCLTFGNTSKKGKTGFIGHHGDGLKMGVNVMIRETREFPSCVIFVTGKHRWDFCYDDSGILMAHQTNSGLPKVNGVLTQIRNFPIRQVYFDRFLFLKPPKERLSSEMNVYKIGSILLDEEYKEQIFVST
ncbi:hypothetical protein BDP27DRAFT_429220 [Rhodocollybia butyracea]|uniref:Uncharacterized protein n=1 Tax=Rhodocollybia butyracea TaxID=206335 RepID=A0A9P5TYY6_9AGAR|nr:hypothetical protein BDP27DRAFT_429220 [Rhodocollybia butyracea]